jgi:gamma-glutamylcyclotransferase
MWSARMKSRAPSADGGVMASLGGHMLKFHKCGLRDGTGKCNAFFSGNAQDIVYGVLYQIDEAEKPDIDEIEGLGLGYNLKDVAVTLADGVNITAWMYVADPAHIDDNLIPTNRYVKIVLDGALEHKLPHDYILHRISANFSEKGRAKPL